MNANPQGNSYLGVNDVYAKKLDRKTLSTTYNLPKDSMEWLDELLDKNNKFQIKPKYAKFCGDITDPTGDYLLFRVEFQFHTPDSFNTKMGYIDPGTGKKKGVDSGWTKMNEGHHLYEVMRGTDGTIEQKQKACEAMVAAANGLWKLSVFEGKPSKIDLMGFDRDCKVGKDGKPVEPNAVNCLLNAKSNKLNCANTQGGFKA